jgi:hypothetical protein
MAANRWHVWPPLTTTCLPTDSSSKVKVKVILWLTVSRPVYFGVKLHLGPKSRYLLLSDSCGFVDVGRSLWRQDGSVVYNCYWPSPAQSFLGPSAVGLATIFYCLRFETSIFVASYDSQGYGGCIRHCLHTGFFWFVQLDSLYNLSTESIENTASMIPL